MTAGSSPDTAANCASATACCEGRPSEDPHFGATRIEVRLAYGPLRPPVRMRLEIEPWSPTATALELMTCQRVTPSAAYFAAGHRLLDGPLDQARSPAVGVACLAGGDDHHAVVGFVFEVER